MDGVPVQKQFQISSRTVELFRGFRGYGFTLSGQSPCVLSNIVQGSPAAIAGLNIGDYVLEANGRNVSDLGHDDVVKWIAGSGLSGSSLQLKIGMSNTINPSFDSQMGLPESSIVKPPSFPTFEVTDDNRRNDLYSSSSDDEIQVKKGQKGKFELMSRQNHVASDDEGQMPGISPAKQPPRLMPRDTNRMANEDDRRDSNWKSNNRNNIVGSSSQNHFQLGGYPKPIHVRGHSEDSTLTDGSTWLPSPAAIASRRPKR